MISSWLNFFLLGSFGFGVFSAPSKASYKDPELTSGYYEGDIILNVARNGLFKANRLWPSAIVPYVISDQFEQPFADQIVKAMRTIEEVSCVRFVPAVNETGYLSVLVSALGCNAHLGYANSTRTLNLVPVILDKGCFKLAVIIHELLHILGFTHMQNSPDRDKYVKIVKKNIIAGKEMAFEKKNTANFNTFGQPYDYGSIMHYNALAFSVNGLPTIKALKPEGSALMGQRIKMSNIDIIKLNKMYNCTT